MYDFLTLLDGTDRKPFPSQTAFLDWLQGGWDDSRIHAGNIPPGVGKSFIARTIQRATGAAVITPSNMLVDQYSRTYPKVNVLKGRQHYPCGNHKVNCAEVKDLGFKPCSRCPYKTARRNALDGQSTFYNPMSLYYLTRDGDMQRSPVTVVDEAHSLIDMLLLMAGEQFSSGKFRMPESLAVPDVLAWTEDQSDKAHQAYEFYAARHDNLKSIAALNDAKRLDKIHDWLSTEPENYVIYNTFTTSRAPSYKEERTLNVVPIDPPKELIQTVLGPGKIVLLSATLSKADAAVLSCGESFRYIDMPSPIPVASRPIFYDPLPCPANADTDVKVIADHIKKILDRNPGSNALVHVTYDLGRKLVQYLPGAFANTPDDKQKTIERFKQHGGVFLAAGCSEGLDLPDDECRVNIVPILPRPNLGDPAVRKWRARIGGDKRYDRAILRTLQQQVGRSTRHIGDHSRTYICDPQFPNVVSRNREDVSISFMTAICWKRG